MRYGLLIVGVLALSGCYRYDETVEGRITSSGSRWKASASVDGTGGAGQEKIALQLDPYKASGTIVETAAGADGLFIECISTRCAALRQDQCVRLMCRNVRRRGEPDVVQCKMDRTILCSALGGS